MTTNVVNVTNNGEITLDNDSGLFTVWDESYSVTLCVTPYPKIAVAVLKTYVEFYINEPQQTKAEQVAEILLGVLDIRTAAV